MSDVTHLLDRCESGDPAAAEALLPLVYDELRRLARRRMNREAGDLTLQATGLVHEAYLRLVRPGNDRPSAAAGSEGGTADGAAIGAGGWDSRGHFFAAAAEAMRRILIERARRRGRLKHGGGRRRASLSSALRAGAGPAVDPPGFADDGGAGELLALDAALDRFEAERPRAAAVVKLRYFAGLSFEETAAALDISRATAVRDWTLGRAWLHREIAGFGGGGDFS
ncbi:ECF-type sigma factor [Alienimonas sp. DA493]|uniref:ECF-type sigma factor n=1 Tax=Alienimonas sp. DA493 TaxID=3373605 RepID=UPI0037551DB7